MKLNQFAHQAKVLKTLTSRITKFTKGNKWKKPAQQLQIFLALKREGNVNFQTKKQKKKQQKEWKMNQIIMGKKARMMLL